ncbi:hypothetical protein KUV44_11800 [Marinobacter daepoensis]|uniref:Alpha/beta hydrolase n=1 Tax=Marinobacter daepoensis TaxID=262077 RepID=A0ABS3BGD9_9GAMM|nr:hypothetical protein [Marinobacter daepoensis]MBN7770380.1 hypothetical protein [Marinobacter daepoensis]MBY6079826.1 hypothetical protein [Marinobacter daepoensis]
MSCHENCQCRPGVVALVFVPGIMGTRLKNRRSGSSVWDPAAGADFDGPSGAAIEIKAQREQEMADAQAEDDDGKLEALGKWFRRRWVGVKERGDGVVEKGRTARRYAGVVPRVSDFVFAGPVKRKQLLVNGDARRRGSPVVGRDDALLVVDDGADDYFRTYTAVPPSQVSEKRQRGWGEVHWDSYGPFLNFLENKGRNLSRLYPGLRFPVFAVGYNWMLSNEAAGARLKERIADFRQHIVDQDDRGIGPADVKFLVISHSMGGYASRAGFVMAGLEAEVEAVIHGAMPTHGSPATYKKFRAGESGGAKFVLGKNAADVTAILGFCQGGLELLPNQLYRTVDNQADWLYLKTADQAPAVVNIGAGSSVFDFYARFDVWYRMIQPELLAPEIGSVRSEGNQLDDHEFALEVRLTGCLSFHQSLADNFHNTTTLVYSNNDNDLSFDRCTWEGGEVSDGGRDEWQVYRHENHAVFFGDGTVSLYGPQEKQDHEAALEAWLERVKYAHHPPPPPQASTADYKLQSETAPGDGTVHAGAGDHPRASGGLKRLGLPATEEHQGFFNCPDVRDLVMGEFQILLPDIHRKLGG